MRGGTGTRWIRRLLALLVAVAGPGFVLSGCFAALPPVPIIHVSPSTEVHTGQTVTFDSRRKAGDPEDFTNETTTYAWDRDGDGTFDLNGPQVTEMTYTQPGTYTVTLGESSPTDDAGDWLRPLIWVHGYTSQKIVVTEPPSGQPANLSPTASFDFSPNPGYTESEITFDASGSSDSDGHVVRYDWQWGDGKPDSTTTSPSAKHTYDHMGQYTAHLTVTDDRGATGATDRTIQVNDGVAPGKLIAGEVGGVAARAAVAGARFSLTLPNGTLTPGTTTASGGKLVTGGINARGRMHFKRLPAVLGRNGSPRWAGVLSLVQEGNGAAAKLTGQGYILVSLSKRNAVCLAGAVAGGLTGAPFSGQLAVAGGKGTGARLRGTASLSIPVGKRGLAVSGRLKLARQRKPRALPSTCRTLARTLRH
jgi:PKD repeat protein